MDAPASAFLSGALTAQQLRSPDPTARSRPGSFPPAEVERVAQDFERMALSEMLSLAMTGTDVSDSLFGGGAGERMMQPFLVEEYARAFARQGGVGISDQVRRELIRMQELQTPQEAGHGAARP